MVVSAAIVSLSEQARLPAAGDHRPRVDGCALAGRDRARARGRAREPGQAQHLARDPDRNRLRDHRRQHRLSARSLGRARRARGAGAVPAPPREGDGGGRPLLRPVWRQGGVRRTLDRAGACRDRLARRHQRDALQPTSSVERAGRRHVGDSPTGCSATSAAPLPRTCWRTSAWAPRSHSASPSSSVPPTGRSASVAASRLLHPPTASILTAMQGPRRSRAHPDRCGRLTSIPACRARGWRQPVSQAIGLPGRFVAPANSVLQWTIRRGRRRFAHRRTKIDTWRTNRRWPGRCVHSNTSDARVRGASGARTRHTVHTNVNDVSRRIGPRADPPNRSAMPTCRSPARRS